MIASYLTTAVLLFQYKLPSYAYLMLVSYPNALQDYQKDEIGVSLS